MSIEISPKSFFEQPSVADMRLIACPGAEELTGLHLERIPSFVHLEQSSSFDAIQQGQRPFYPPNY